MKRLLSLAVLTLVARTMSAEQLIPLRIPNWSAPPVWSLPSKSAAAGKALRREKASEAQTVYILLYFVPITPCRIADTRGNGFTGPYGPPSLTANATRDFAITGQCGVPTFPGFAQAVSVNFAALNVGAPGDLRVFPTGGTIPNVSTLNYNASTPNIANAAVVSLGTGGAITVQADATSIDLIIDVNGFYAFAPVVPSVVSAEPPLQIRIMRGIVHVNSVITGSGFSVTPLESPFKGYLISLDVPFADYPSVTCTLFTDASGASFDVPGLFEVAKDHFIVGVGDREIDQYTLSFIAVGAN